MRLSPTSTVAGVFTKNRFCAAPVQLCKAHLAKVQQEGKSICALMVNTGNANAGTGETGYRDAVRTSTALAKLLNCKVEQVLPFSTGVILEPLPVDRILNGLPDAVADLKEDNWLNAAEAIMTTDTIPKAASKEVVIDGKTVMLKSAVDKSFNCITVDGDTSTNDSLMLIATGKVDIGLTRVHSPNYRPMLEAVTELAQELAQKIIRDGEGASKFITIVVEEGQSEEECRRIAYSVAQSPLVKTAFFASDPILAAIGYAGIEDLDVGKLNLYLDEVWVAKNGGRNPDYQEEDGQRVMKKNEILVRITLARGKATSTVWTCDLSHDYVSINADYRS